MVYSKLRKIIYSRASGFPRLNNSAIILFAGYGYLLLNASNSLVSDWLRPRMMLHDEI